MTTKAKTLSADELDLAFALARGREAGLVHDAKPPLPAIYYCHETTLQSVGRDAFSFVTFAAMIGLGVICHSSAMQWVGSICFFLVMISQAKGRMKKMTPAEIRADLDRLEAVRTPHV